MALLASGRARPRRLAQFTNPHTLAAAATPTGMQGGGSAAFPNRTGIYSEMWGYFDGVPRLHYAANFKARCFSRVKLRPGWRNDEGEIVPITEQLIDEHPEIKGTLPLVARLLSTLKAKKGGQARLMFRFGQILSIAADCWLVATDVVDPATIDPNTKQPTIVDRSWEVLSSDELRKGGRYGWQRHRGLGYQPEDLPPGTNPLRFHKEHPRYTGQADSQVRPLLDTLEVFMLSVRGERSAILSRLTGPGILLVEEDLDFPDDPAMPGTESGDPFAVRLTHTMSTPIGDRGSPSAWTPIVLRTDLSGNRKVMERVQFGEPHETASIAKRIEMEDRIAGGIDLPTETVTGHAQTTFHNAEQITEDLYNQHIKPDVDDLTEDLCAVYLIPSLLKANGIDEKMPPPAPLDRFAIWADASELVADPDRTKQATEGYDRFELSGSAWRRACGFSEDDKPDALEVMYRIWRAQRLGVRETIRANEAITDENGGAPSLVLPSDPSYLPGADDPSVNVVASAAVLDRLVDAVALETMAAVGGACDAVGRQIRGRANGRLPTEWRTAKDLPVGRLASFLPRDLVDELVPPASRWEGRFAGFEAAVAGLLAASGHPRPERSAVELRRLAEAAAERRLFSPTWQLDRGDVLTAIAQWGGE